MMNDQVVELSDSEITPAGKYDVELELETKNSLSVILSRIKPRSRVLEFGPAAGRLTKYMQKNLHCSVYAVEIDQNAAAKTKEFCEKIVVDDVEHYNWLEDYKDLKFDFIVFADVLEHLKSPETAIEKAKMLLSDDGEILLSIPNIAHNAIFIDLLNDRFTYTKTGLLDDTHLRFFTYTELLRWFESIDLFPSFFETITVSPLNTEKTNSLFSLHQEIMHLLQSKKFGDVYQFVFALSKNQAKAAVLGQAISHQSRLYYDTGNGFNENEVLISNVLFDTAAKIEFDLSGLDVSNLKRLRWDPVEGFFIKLDLHDTSIETATLGLRPLSKGAISDNSLTDGIFLTADPAVYVSLIPAGAQRICFSYRLQKLNEHDISQAVKTLQRYTYVRVRNFVRKLSLKILTIIFRLKNART